mgnify:FL=1
MKICVSAPGSCGELIQGTLDGQNFLVSCPINMYSNVIVTMSQVNNNSFSLEPKAELALYNTLKYLKVSDFHYSLSLYSQLPKGKGMASSSADISAICQAVAIATGKILTPNEIAKIAAQIEPTDGIFYKDLVLFDHINGMKLATLGSCPPISILIFDLGGEINTLEFNSRNDLRLLNQSKEFEIKQALKMIKKGIHEGNSSLIGQGATLSAKANQKILYKPYLQEFIEINAKYDGIGVSIAHSGTILGMMFDQVRQGKMKACLAFIKQAFPSVHFIKQVQIISGGVVVKSYGPR